MFVSIEYPLTSLFDSFLTHVFDTAKRHLFYTNLNKACKITIFISKIIIGLVYLQGAPQIFAHLVNMSKTVCENLS